MKSYEQLRSHRVALHDSLHTCIDSVWRIPRKWSVNDNPVIGGLALWD